LENYRPEEVIMNIQVTVTKNYGTDVVYPTCIVGETFALIAGTKTLTTETRELMKRLGYTFAGVSAQVVL